MTLIPRDAFFNRGSFDLDKFFENFWSPSYQEINKGETFFSPRVDISEKDDHYQISAELPGVKKEDIHVTVENGVLTLAAETTQEDTQEQEGRVIRRERRYGKFMRSFSLGDGVHEGDISANFSDGVLTLKAPKLVEQAPPQRRIEVK